MSLMAHLKMGSTQSLILNLEPQKAIDTFYEFPMTTWHHGCHMPVLISLPNNQPFEDFVISAAISHMHCHPSLIPSSDRGSAMTASPGSPNKLGTGHGHYAGHQRLMSVGYCHPRVPANFLKLALPFT